MLGLCLFDYVFWSWCPLCSQSCKLVQNDTNTPAKRGGDTLAASQVQPEHCPNLNVFILKFWLCSFDDMFWSWCSLCPQNCNSTANAPAKRGWGHLGCNLNVTWEFHNLKFLQLKVWIVFIWLFVLVMMSIVSTGLQIYVMCCKYTCQKGWDHHGCNLNATWEFHNYKFT